MISLSETVTSLAKTPLAGIRMIFQLSEKKPSTTSLSLGSTPKFKLRHNVTAETFDYELESGSILIMLPGCQEDWVHAIPKTARPIASG
jgi:alkylated DNA repair dioxygenase AlkB